MIPVDLGFIPQFVPRLSPVVIDNIPEFTYLAIQILILVHILSLYLWTWKEDTISFWTPILMKFSLLLLINQDLLVCGLGLLNEQIALTTGILYR